MLNFRNLRKGDRVHFHSVEFDGTCDEYGTVTETESDHAVMTGEDGMHYWIDDGTAGLFLPA